MSRSLAANDIAVRVEAGAVVDDVVSAAPESSDSTVT